MDRFTRLLPYLLLGALSVPLVLTLAPDASSSGGLQVSQPPEEIRNRSLAILEGEGIDSEDMRSELNLRPNRKLLRQVHSLYGLQRGNEVLRSWDAAYRWNARWSEKSSINVSFNGQSDDEAVDQVDSWLKGDVRIEFDMRGNVVGYERTIPDSLSLPSIPPDSTVHIARAFLIRSGSPNLAIGARTLLDMLDERSIVARPQQLLHRTDHLIEFTESDSVTGNTVIIGYRVAGSFISTFEIEHTVPTIYSDSTTRTYSSIFESIAFVVLFITMVVVSFKRFRAYEIGFRIAIVVGAASAIGLGVKLYTLLSPSAGWEIIFPLLFGPLFYGGGAVLVWAASESTVRETWREKVIPLDLLAKGHFTHPRIGQSIVKGVTVGIAIHALFLVSKLVIGQFTHIGLAFSEDGLYDYLASDVPSLTILLEGFYGQVYTVAFFFMFLASWIYKQTGKVMLSGAVIVVLLIGVKCLVYEPLWTGLLIGILPFTLLVVMFLRHDIVTTFLAMMVGTVSESGTVLLSSTHPALQESAGVLAVVLGLLVVTGFLSQIRSHTIVDFDSIAPAYSKHITERERLRHELAIARSVQMSFLPKTNPVITTLDIASRCAPALEVGGDYYDFIELPDRQLGVAVGDVSGKGTQAAFFMTLTKGFLRALARISQSPGTVLTEVNRLFYENVDRGVFISLIYGIFDTRDSRLTIARAGHNPVILRKSVKRNTQVLDPMGLALGLDKGDIFEESIKEVSVPYEKGDVFVFYTDGISEAMNRTREEYGEARLSSSIETHAHRSSAEILEGVLHDMETFVGKAEQHDDVTLVVVKII